MQRKEEGNILLRFSNYINNSTKKCYKSVFTSIQRLLNAFLKLSWKNPQNSNQKIFERYML